MRRVLVLGVPRSGTTWIGQVLARTHDALYIHEPDGVTDPFAFHAQRRDHRTHYPVLHADDNAPEFARLWDGAFAGGQRNPSWRNTVAYRAYRGVTAEQKVAARVSGRLTPRLRAVDLFAEPRIAGRPAATVIVKSVHGALAADWIARHSKPTVLVVHRDLRNVMASWLTLGFGGTHPAVYATARAEAARRWQVDLPDYDDPLVRSIAFCAVMMLALLDSARAHDDWHLAVHEDVCIDSAARLAAVATALGLEWTPEAEAFVAASDRPGDGYETSHVAADLPDQWKRKLTPQQIDSITAVLAEFPEGLWLTPPLR